MSVDGEIMVDDFLFSGEEPEEPVEQSTNGVWKILIVDDEPEVHAVTKLALSDFSFQNKALEFLSAYNGAEAKSLLKQHEDICTVLLDVVMETDDAGLQVADYIRSTLKNQRVRIILRTGQPGQAPERQVIINYDINDYKSKTELTAQKLFTVVMASLRSYRDILALEKSQKGLRKIIEASSNIFTVQSMEQFIHGVMQQLTSIIGCGEENALYVSNSMMVKCLENHHDKELRVLAAQGKFATAIGKLVNEIGEISAQELNRAFEEAIRTRSIVYKNDYLIAYCHSRLSTNSLLFVSGLPDEIDEAKKELVELFAQHVQVAFENIQMKEELEESQTELLIRLGGAVEKRLNDKGQHIKRITDICKAIGKWANLTESETELLGKAAPLHDIGKINIQPEILIKDSELTEDEKLQLKKVPLHGENILHGSEREMLQIAAIVAGQHQENWDGSGYPKGLSGRQIHIYARIVAIANNYDSVRSKLSYAEENSHEKAIEFLINQKNKKFDPSLVDVVVSHQDEMDEIFNSKQNFI